MSHLNDYSIAVFENPWYALSSSESAQNATVGATQAAIPNQRLFVSKVDASYLTSGTATFGLLTVYAGATLIGQKATIQGGAALDLGSLGIPGSSTNQAMTAYLSAGGQAVTGIISMYGYAVNEGQ